MNILDFQNFFHYLRLTLHTTRHKLTTTKALYKSAYTETHKQTHIQLPFTLYRIVVFNY